MLVDQWGINVQMQPLSGLEDNTRQTWQDGLGSWEGPGPTVHKQQVGNCNSSGQQKSLASSPPALMPKQWE